MLAIFFTSNSGKIGCSLQELFHFSRELFRIVEILRDAPNAYIRRSPVGDQMSNSDDTVYTFFYGISRIWLDISSLSSSIYSKPREVRHDPNHHF